jgi:hypothetical protein
MFHPPGSCYEAHDRPLGDRGLFRASCDELQASGPTASGRRYPGDPDAVGILPLSEDSQLLVK